MLDEKREMKQSVKKENNKHADSPELNQVKLDVVVGQVVELVAEVVVDALGRVLEEVTDADPAVEELGSQEAEHASQVEIRRLLLTLSIYNRKWRQLDRG